MNKLRLEIDEPDEIEIEIAEEISNELNISDSYKAYLESKGLEEASTLYNHIKELLDIESDMAISFLGDGLKESLEVLSYYYGKVLPLLIKGEITEELLYMLEVDNKIDLERTTEYITAQLEIKYGHLYK